jgi:hypothetical protein
MIRRHKYPTLVCDFSRRANPERGCPRAIRRLAAFGTPNPECRFWVRKRTCERNAADVAVTRLSCHGPRPKETLDAGSTTRRPPLGDRDRCPNLCSKNLRCLREILAIIIHVHAALAEGVKEVADHLPILRPVAVHRSDGLHVRRPEIIRRLSRRCRGRRRNEAEFYETDEVVQSRR